MAESSKIHFSLFLMIVGASITLQAQTAPGPESPSAIWAAHAAAQYNVIPNITYLTANNFEIKVDVYRRKDTTATQPTMISIHRGGWTGGTRDSLLFLIMPGRRLES